MFVFVLLVWIILAVIGSYFVVKRPAMAPFRDGFMDFWRCVASGRDVSKAADDTFYGPGFFAGIVSLIVAIIVVLILFVVTLVWAW